MPRFIGTSYWFIRSWFLSPESLVQHVAVVAPICAKNDENALATLCCTGLRLADFLVGVYSGRINLGIERKRLLKLGGVGALRNDQLPRSCLLLPELRHGNVYGRCWRRRLDLCLEDNLLRSRLW